MKKAGAVSIDLYNKKKTRTGLINNIKLKSSAIWNSENCLKSQNISSRTCV